MADPQDLKHQNPLGDFAAALDAAESRSRITRERNYKRLIEQVPIPAASLIYDELRGVVFTRHEELLNLHPGSKLATRIKIFKRAHRMLMDFFGDLQGAHGRFQGYAMANQPFADQEWDQTAFDFTKALFTFSAGAKAAYEMMSRLADRSMPVRGRDIFAAAEAKFDDGDLTSFVHELRNHLSHFLLEEPSSSIHREHGEVTRTTVSVSVEASRFSSGRWAPSARIFLNNNRTIDLMDVATKYVGMAIRAEVEVGRSFWAGLTEAERNFFEIKKMQDADGKRSSYGFITQLFQQNTNPLRFLYDRLTGEQKNIIASYRPRSEAQFEVAVRLLDPMRVVDQSTVEHLRRKFVTAGHETDG